MDLQYIPIQDRDYITCLNAIMRSGLALQFVTEEMKTLNMCQKAVDQNSHAIKYVPDGIKMIMHSPALRDTETLFGMPAYICSYGGKHYNRNLGCECSQLKEKAEVQPFDEEDTNTLLTDLDNISAQNIVRSEIVKELEKEREEEIMNMRRR